MAQISSISNGEALSSVRTKLNDVITNVNLLDPTGWVDYSATSTVVGWSSFTTKVIKYRIIGKQMFINASITGTSNSGSASFTLPNNNIMEAIYQNNYVVNNGSQNQGLVSINKNSGTVSVVYWLNTSSTSLFTTSGTKTISCQLSIEIA